MEARTPYLLAEREAKYNINRLILEELTVSRDVADASDEVLGRILSCTESAEPVSFTDGGWTRHGSFRTTLFGDVDATFSVTNHNFTDGSCYNRYRKKYSTNVSCGSSYREIGDLKTAMFWINYISVKHKPTAKLAEDLHHELNHIWQQYSEGGTYQDRDRYSVISSDIYSKDQALQDVATLLYLCSPNEQDSFVSSVYGFVKHHYLVMSDGTDMDTWLKSTDAYRNICEMHRLYRKICSDREVYREIVLDKHGFSRWDRFDKRVRNAMHRFERKFAMCVKKCKKDFLVYEGNTWCDAGLGNGIYLLS